MVWPWVLIHAKSELLVSGSCDVYDKLVRRNKERTDGTLSPMFTRNLESSSPPGVVPAMTELSSRTTALEIAVRRWYRLVQHQMWHTVDLPELQLRSFQPHAQTLAYK